MMGYFGVRRENKALFWSFFIGCIAGAAYFIYKVKLLLSRWPELS